MTQVVFKFFLDKIKRRTRKIMIHFVIFRHPMCLMVCTVARRNYSVLAAYIFDSMALKVSSTNNNQTILLILCTCVCP